VVGTAVTFVLTAVGAFLRRGRFDPGPGAPSPVVSAAAAVGYWEQFEEDEDIAEEQSESESEDEAELLAHWRRPTRPQPAPEPLRLPAAPARISAPGAPTSTLPDRLTVPVHTGALVVPRYARPRRHGCCRWFDFDKGYGLIQPDDAPDTVVFVHWQSVREEAYAQLRDGAQVTFREQLTVDGPQAVDVEVVPGPGPPIDAPLDPIRDIWLNEQPVGYEQRGETFGADEPWKEEWQEAQDERVWLSNGSWR